MFVTILCYVLLITVIYLYLLSLLLNSYFDYCFHECYCTMCYMYLQVIQINIIIIIIITWKLLVLILVDMDGGNQDLQVPNTVSQDPYYRKCMGVAATPLIVADN